MVITMLYGQTDIHTDGKMSSCLLYPPNLLGWGIRISYFLNVSNPMTVSIRESVNVYLK